MHKDRFLQKEGLDAKIGYNPPKLTMKPGYATYPGNITHS